jgi:hypothetical protein
VKDTKFERKRQKEERKRKIVVKVYERSKNVGKKPKEGKEFNLLYCGGGKSSWGGRGEG